MPQRSSRDVVVEAAASLLRPPASPLPGARARVGCVWASVVDTLGHSMYARLTLLHQAPLDWALAFVDAVLPHAQSTASTSGAVRLNMAPPATGAT